MHHFQLVALITLTVLASQPVKSAESQSPQPPMEPLAFGCSGCHGTTGGGWGSIPKISGKPEAEFVHRMQEFRSGKRQSTVMDRIARAYSDEDLATLAKYFSHR